MDIRRIDGGSDTAGFLAPLRNDMTVAGDPPNASPTHQSSILQSVLIQDRIVPVQIGGG